MKELKILRNGTYLAEEVEKVDNDFVKSVGDAKIIKTNESFRYWDEYSMKYYEENAGINFVIVDDIAYPLSVPFSEADEDEGIEEQEYPETWEDVVFHIEGFGR